MEKICVAVRVRPPVPPPSQDAPPGATGIHWKLEDNHISLHRSHGTPISGLAYTFDHVFDEISTNSQVYALLTKDIIHAAVHGFNGTAFVYGQTSSGKTYTMNGSQSDPGIIQRAVKDVFNLIDSMRDREFLIRVSYMEIYNEEINDLFAVENQKLPIHESLDRGIFVAGLREEIVNNAEQVLKLMESGEVNRHFGETNMNTRSSRSHTIFRMVIESKGKDSGCSDDYSFGDAIRVSVLNLVDLAGSERIAKTGARGVRLKEGKHINKSLMVLGNVINKLSEGPKQRGHIPYRDSKLTRILQPALGGNAKTSIICTVAPEEIHVEETKGTLQFASRAKRITNCAQVNEVLSDAALLKRQKLEIEELRKNLEGSRAEVLEQEVLKLRNEMLTYELEREKLEMQLEEERKSHLERDQCIREQRMNINSLNDLATNSNSDKKSHLERDQCIREQRMNINSLNDFATNSNSDKNSSQGSGLQRGREEFNDSNSFSQGDIFKTPCLKSAPNSFVGKRSAYSRLPDCSPLPDNFSNVADEDTWLQMNKGYVADLDSIQMTPARKVQSFPPSDVTPEYPSDKEKHEVHDLRRQLDIVIKEKNELEKKHSEQLLLNDHLMREISKHNQETLTIQEIPQSLRESVASYKDVYKDIFLTLQSSVPNQESGTAKLLACIVEICTTLFSNLESDISMAMNGHKPSQMDYSTAGEKYEVHSKKLKSAITSLVSSETSATYQVKETTSWQEKLSGELVTMKEKYHELEKELSLTSQQLEVYRERYSGMERDLHLLKDERDSLLEKLSESSEKLLMVTEQKENVLKDLNIEARRRKDLQDYIKQLSVAFGRRQRSSMLLHREIKSKIEKMRSPNPISLLP